MDWKFITHHLLSGYIPMLAASALYFIFLHMIGKKQTAAHVITSFIFNFYLIGILTLTGICLRGSFSPRIVFIPFIDMIRGPKDTILNVLLFIPLGCFLPLLYEKYDSIGKIAFMGFLVSLSVEIVQMFGYGATDINDLITNTIGACLGFFIFTILYRMIPRSWFKLTRVEGTQCYYEPLFFWIASISVMLTVQIYIFHRFFPAKMSGGEIQEWK